MNQDDTELVLSTNKLRGLIYTVRGVQVMLDSDLAALYTVETKVFNQAVKRNDERFPESFRFQLTQTKFQSLKSQFVTLNKQSGLKSQNVVSSDSSLRSQIATLETGRGKHRKYLPYAFTEQGIAMLSTVLRSDTAIRTSIQSINAFDGQIFDAYVFINDLLRQAKKSIVLIDNYIDDSVLLQLAKRRNLDAIIKADAA